VVFPRFLVIIARPYVDANALDWPQASCMGVAARHGKTTKLSRLQKIGIEGY
jgi:hypothetical protein